MRVDMTLRPNQFNTTFLSHQRDLKFILEKLFIHSKPYSDKLKRLLVVNHKDCLDMNKYTDVDQKTLAELKEEEYILISPTLKQPEHAVNKSVIIISMDNYRPNNTNPQFRNCSIRFDIMCPTDSWDIGDFQLRPFAIAGYIDGILNDCKLSGIGKIQFVSCEQLLVTPEWSGYTLLYNAIHGNEDESISNTTWEKNYN